MFKRDWVGRYDYLPEQGPGDEILQSWDTASKDGPANDWSVCVTWRRSTFGRKARTFSPSALPRKSRIQKKGWGKDDPTAAQNTLIGTGPYSSKSVSPARDLAKLAKFDG